LTGDYLLDLTGDYLLDLTGDYFLDSSGEVDRINQEVKGGRILREKGEWKFVDRYNNTNSRRLGPFEQAKDGMFSVIENLRKRVKPNMSHIPKLLFGFGVMFPDIIYEASGLDEEQYQIFDSRDGCDVRKYILNLSRETAKKVKKSLGPSFVERYPTNNDAKYILDLLRGDFDRVVPLSVEISNLEKTLLKLTKEQYRCLDQLEDNPRCVIHGPAGTGKTLLALEAAKKAVVEGKKVALFCYNTKLGEYLEGHFSLLPENQRPFYTGTIHKFLMKTLKAKNIAVYIDEHATHEFYSELVPSKFIELMLGEEPLFDKIIVDEAQDLLEGIYFDVFDLSLSKGFDRGEWILFGDFHYQAIFSDGGNILSALYNRTSFVNYKLSINCRNTLQIIDQIDIVVGEKSSLYAENKVKGPPVNYLNYSSSDEQANKLSKLLEVLLTEDLISPNEITILSPYKFENSVVSILKDSFNVKTDNTSSSTEILFSTIQSFKGLENKIIIITDVQNYNDRSLLYVGISRARYGLYVFLSNQANEKRYELVKRRLEYGSIG